VFVVTCAYDFTVVASLVVAVSSLLDALSSCGCGVAERISPCFEKIDDVAQVIADFVSNFYHHGSLDTLFMKLQIRFMDLLDHLAEGDFRVRGCRSCPCHFHSCFPFQDFSLNLLNKHNNILLS
jgi:hypothetical protein